MGGGVSSERELRRRAWIGLSLLPKWNPDVIWRAVGDKDGNPIPVWQRYGRLLQVDPVQAAMDAAKKHGATVVTWDDPCYPINLRTSLTPAPVLYIRGQLLRADAASIALVGSRRASPQGLRLAYLLGQQIAQRGLTVVSGLATGIDAAAHAGALAVGGRTIAVIGSGVDIVYPKTNAKLAEEIPASGAILSEFPCGTPPRKRNFPTRNRTLAGMALGTCVVEAGEKSGALITARLASECDRVLMACPGDVLREHTKGSNRLIQDGAMVILAGEDCLLPLQSKLESLPALTVEHSEESVAHSPDGTAFAHAVPAESQGLARRIWLILMEGPAHPDEIAIRTNTSSAEVVACIMHLVVKDYVRKRAGGLYTLALAPESASMVT